MLKESDVDLLKTTKSDVIMERFVDTKKRETTSPQKDFKQTIEAVYSGY